MRNDVHLAALRAAARVAFSVASVAIVNGCSSADTTDAKEDNNNNGDTTSEETASNESAVISRPRPAPCHDAGAPAKPSCEAVLKSAFPVPGDYQYKPVAQPANVVSCCDAELVKNGAGSDYRWDCCVAYDPAKVPAGEEPGSPFGGPHALACTPWGPPVPPSMARRALIAARRAARANANDMMMMMGAA